MRMFAESTWEQKSQRGALFTTTKLQLKLTSLWDTCAGRDGKGWDGQCEAADAWVEQELR